MDTLDVSAVFQLSVDEVDVDPEYQRIFPPLSEEDRAQLAESIKRSGMLSPICVASRGRRYVVLDGHHRLTIAKELNWPRVPCLIARDAVQEVDMLYSANLQRRQLSPEERNRLLLEFRARLGPEEVRQRDSALELIRSHVEFWRVTAPEVFQCMETVQQATPVEPPVVADRSPRQEAADDAEGDAEKEALRQRAEVAEHHLKELERRFKRMSDQHEDLQQIVEYYERRTPESQQGADSAMSHLQKELMEVSRRFGDLSRKYNVLSEERDKLRDEVALAKQRENDLLNGHCKLLASELEQVQQENRQFRDLLNTSQKAAACLRSAARAVEELEILLDHHIQPWTEEERRAVSEAYTALADVWDRARKLLDLALGGFPAGRSIFDRMFPDARHREPLEQFLAAREGKAPAVAPGPAGGPVSQETERVRAKLREMLRPPELDRLPKMRTKKDHDQRLDEINRLAALLIVRCTELTAENLLSMPIKLWDDEALVEVDKRAKQVQLQIKAGIVSGHWTLKDMKLAIYSIFKEFLDVLPDIPRDDWALGARLIDLMLIRYSDPDMDLLYAQGGWLEDELEELGILLDEDEDEDDEDEEADLTEYERLEDSSDR